MYKDDDVLNILNSNTQNNNYNEGKDSDEVLNVLNTNTEEINTSVDNVEKFSPKLTDEEYAARESASVDFDAGINHVDNSEVNFLRDSGAVKNADGTINNTKSLATELSLDEKSLTTSELYKDTLGRTAYEDLKVACGLSKEDSFTDFYNKNQYVPKGWEMEAKMCLIEEKRMKLYTDYTAGKMSETDFLYQAYGKDLMKEAGYDLSSKLFWYNRIKNGDRSSPLDSETFLTDLIANARTMWQNESWFRDSANKKMSETLAGLVTGNRLSDEKFYEIFKNQVDALKPYFNEDVSKIITYYKAGNLGSAFSPFVDTDGDGKYDYYFHTDGRLYAVKDSSGVGESKCTIVYNEDGSVHSVQINDGFDGPVDSLLEGFRDFWVGLLDIGSMVVSLFTGIGDAANGGTYWVDSQQRWNAFKKSTWALGDEDYVTFDDIKKYNGDDWANAISKGIGQVAGMVVLTVLTAGIGTAAQQGGNAIKAGKQVGATAAEELSKNGAEKITEEMVKNSVNSLREKVIEKLGTGATEKMITRATENAVVELGKQLGANMGKTAFESSLKNIVAVSIGKSTTKVAMANVGTRVAQAATGVLTAGTKGRSGFVISTKGVMGSAWGQSIQIAATNAVKDFASVMGQLEAKNNGLKYLEKVTDGQVTALTKGDMLTRAFATAGADLVISSMFRAQGDIGTSTRFNEIFKKNKFLTENAKALLADPNIKDGVRLAALNMTKNMKASMLMDNFFDVTENILTAGAQAAFSNPYAKLGSKESWQTFLQSIYNPQSIIMNVYIGAKNAISYGSSQNMADSRMSTFIKQANLNVKVISSSVKNYINDIEASNIDTIKKDSMINALTKLNSYVLEKLNNVKEVENETRISASARNFNNIMETAMELDDVFSIDDSKAVKAFGLSSEEVKEVRDAITLLNSTKSDKDKPYGMVTAMLFNRASKEEAEKVKAVYKDLINIAASKAESTSKAWKSFINFTGKLPFHEYVKSKQAMASFRDFLNNVSDKAKYDLSGLRDIDIKNLIVSNRFKTLSFDEGTSYFKFKQAIDSGLIKTYVMDDATALAGYKFDIVEADEGYDVKILDSNNKERSDVDFGDNPFFQILTDKANNKAAIDQLIKMGIITSVGNDKESESLYSIMASGTPWFGFTVDQAMRNEILKNDVDNPLRDIVIAMDTIADLCNPDLSADADGYAGIDWSVPLFTRVSYTRKNSSGGESEASLYIIPNQSSSHYLDIINRMQAAQGMIYNYYKILTLSKIPLTSRSESQTEELQKAIACFTFLMDEHLVMNDYEDVKKVMSDPARRKEYVEERLPQTVKAILFKADMSQDETNQGFGRNQLVKLYRDGILDENILTKLADESEKNSKVGEVARELLTYNKLVNTTKDVLKIVSKINSDGKLSNSDLNTMKNYVQLMNEPSNAKIKEYLEKDNYLTDYLEKIIKDPTDYIPFFKGLVGNGRHLSQEECSAILEKRRIDDSDFVDYISNLIGDRYNDFVSRTNDYVDRVKKTFTKIFYGQDYNYSRDDNYFKTLSKDKVLEFMVDPLKVMEGMSSRKIHKLFTFNQDAETFYSTSPSNLAKEILTRHGLLTEDGKIDSNKIFIETYNIDSETPLTSVEIKREILKGETDQARLFRNLILIANKDYIGDFNKKIVDDNGNEKDFIRSKDNKLYVGKDNELLGDYLFNNTDVKQMFIESKKEAIIDRIRNDIELYDKYIGEDTDLMASKNIIEVNLLELLPKNLKSAVGKFLESIEAKSSRGAKARIENNEIKKSLEDLFTGSFSTSTTEQYVAYKKLVLSKIVNGNFLYSYDINNSKSLDKFRTLMFSLGYGKDVSKVISNAIQIDGVSVKNKPMHVIKTDLQARKMFETLMKMSPVSFISTVREGKDYKYVLRNLFSSNKYVNADTIFNAEDIKIDNGVTLLGDYKDWTQTEGMSEELLDRAIKAALQGGNFADNFTIFNKNTEFEGQVNQMSRETYKALKIINRVFEYLFDSKTEYRSPVVRIGCKKNNQKFKDILDMYSKPDSIWNAKYNDRDKCFEIYRTDNVVTVNDFIKTHIANNNNEFDFKELVPIWDAKTSAKSVDFKMDKDISYETLFSIISEMEFEDLTKIEDFVEYASKPIKLMNTDLNAYEGLLNKVTGKRLSEIIRILDSNQDLIENNYYANLLGFFFKNTMAKSEVLENALSTEETKPLLSLCDSEILDKIGDLLNGNYKTILNGEAIDDDAVSALANDVMEATNKYVSDESIKALLTILKDAEENQLVSLSSDTGLSKRNPTLNAFGFLEMDDEGKLSVSMEEYIKTAEQDREVFLSNLELILKTEELSNEEKSSIKTLIDQLTTKNSLITSLNADKGLTIDHSNLKDILTFESTSPNEPSVKINPTDYFLSSGNNFNKKLAASLVTNRQFLKKGQDKYIALSSMSNTGDTVSNLLSDFMRDVLGRTLNLTTGKKGSALVYNMQSDEAVGEFFMSSYTWAHYIKEAVMTDDEGNFVNKFKGLSEQEVNKMLYDLAMKANLYSTGTTFAEEYAGALMLEYDPSSKEYKIKPIVTSVSNPDDDILSSLIIGRNKLDDNDDKVKFMIKVKQNTFIENISGYNSGFDVFDLTDEDVRKSVYLAAYYNAKRGGVWYINPDESEHSSYKDIIKSHYIDTYKLKAYDLRRHFYNTCRTYGLSDDVIKTVLQNVETVAQDTSWNEQAIETLKRNVGITNDRFVENIQFKALHDALLYGINKDALKKATLFGFDNFMNKFDATLKTNEVENALVAVEKIASYNAEDNELGYKFFATLSDEEQRDVLMHLLVDSENTDGVTLTMIANARNGKNLYDVYEHFVKNYKHQEHYSKQIVDMFDNIFKYVEDKEHMKSLMSSVTFDGLDLSHDKNLFDDVDIFGDNALSFSRDSAFLYSVREAFNLMEESKALRADSKELENRKKDVLVGNGYNSYSRRQYLSSVRSKNKRNEVRNVFFNLLNANGVDFSTIKVDKENDADTLKNQDLSKALTNVFNKISKAAYKYGEDLKEKNKYDETIQNYSLSDKIEVFLASGEENMLKYLGDAFTKSEFKHYPSGTLTMFDGKYGSKMVEALKANFDFEQAERDTLVNRFVTTVMNPLNDYMEKSKEKYLKNINPAFLLANLTRVSGYTTEGKELYEKHISQRENLGKLISITSNTNKELYDYIIDDLFQKELFSVRALWSMAHEHKEFVNGIPYGCIKVSSKILNKSFGLNPETNEPYKNGDTLYTLMWRQPGQQRTVVHNVKVLVDDDYTFALSRMTARDYFNGDMDGDSFFKAMPDAAMQSFGKNTFDVLNYGGSLFDSLFEDINIPMSSAKEFASYENTIVPYFKSQDAQNLIYGIFNKTNSVDDFNSHFKLWLDDNTQYDEDTKNMLVSAFGFKERTTAMINKNRVITSNNYILDTLGNLYNSKDKNKVNVINEILKGNEAFLRAAFTLSDDDATYLGQSSKGQLRNFAVKEEQLKKVSNALYETTIGMSKDSNAQLTKLFNAIKNDANAIQTIKKRVCDYIDLGVKQGFISKNRAEQMKFDVNEEQSFDQNSLYCIAHILQVNKVNSQAYDKVITTAIKAPEAQAQRVKNNNKINGVIGIMKKIGGFDIPKELTDIMENNPYGPESLTVASRLAEQLLDRRFLENPMFMATKDNTGVTTLLRDFATKCDVDVISKNNLHIVSHKNVTGINKNVIGVSGKVIIAVSTDGSYTDSVGVYDRTLNGGKNLDVNKCSRYTIGDLSDEQKVKLVSTLKSLAGTIKTEELQDIFKDSSFKEHGVKNVLALTNALNKQISLSSLTPEDITRNCQIVFNEQTDLLDHVRNNVVKFGAVTTKDFKGTGYATDIIFKGSAKKNKIPQLLFDQKIASMEKLAPLTGFKNLNQTIIGTDKNGNKHEFALCEIDNIALLNVLDMEDMSYSNREMDVVSLLSGSQGIDASFNMGNLFITVTSDGKVMYDPSGYRNLMSTISNYTRPVLQDVNGVNLVRYNRIAILLDQIKDNNRLAKTIAKISSAIDSEANNIKDLMTSLETVGDLGGYTGEQIESAIYATMTHNEKVNFRKMLRDSKEDNTFARVFFSKEVQDTLDSNIQTSAEINDDYVAQKKEDIAHTNPRIANVSNYSEGSDYVRLMEGSARDLNTSFISRRALLNLLLTETNRRSGKDYGLNSSLMNEMLRNGYIEPEDIWTGNIADGYNPILKYQGLELDPNEYPERTQSKKAGMFFNMDMGKRNREIENLIGYVDKSLLPNNNHKYSDSLINEMNYLNNLSDASSKYRYFSYTPATRVLPYLTKGTDEDIFDGLTGYRTKFIVDRMHKNLELNNDELQLGVNYSSINDLREQHAPNSQMALPVDVASEYLKHLEHGPSSELYKQLIRRDKINLLQDLSSFNFLDRLHLLEDRQALNTDSDSAKAFKELLIDQSKIDNDIKSFRTIEQGSYEDACWDNLSSANLVACIQLTSSKNGYEFYNSAMRSWGFKSDDNKDIALGSRVLKVNAVADNEAKNLLGNEYIHLVNASKHCKDLALELDQYLQVEKLIELYESFKQNETAFRKAMPKQGKDSYDSRMMALEEVLKEQGGIEALRSYTEKIYKENVALSILIDDATAINKRIVEASKQISPYEYVSWFVNLNGQESERKLFGWETINAFDLSHQKFEDVLLGSMQRSSNRKLASIFSGTNDGYLASVTIAATNLAKKKAIKSLSRYMKDNGYMSNLDLYSISMEQIGKDLEKNFLETFKEGLANGKADRKQYAYDVYTYNQLKHIAIENGITAEEFNGYESFLNLYGNLTDAADARREALHYTSFQDLVEARNATQGYGTDVADKEKLDSAVRIYNAAQNVLSTMVAMMVERGKYKSAESYLAGIYDIAKARCGNLGDYVIVDKYGAKLEETDKYVPSFLNGFDMDDAIREMKYGKGITGDAKKSAIAQMIICGDAYVMKKSLADQLEKKLFTAIKHSKFYNLINKCKNIGTSLIMSSPTQLLDRVINFPTFDLGVDATADFRTLNEVPTARATVNKFIAMFDNLTQDQVDNDKDLQYLIRFLYASNQDLKNATSYRGEKLGTGSLPLLKQYLKMSNQLYTIGNTIPRFAYFLNMVKDAEANGYQLNPNRMGVAYHMQDGIKAMTNDVDADVYKHIDGDENKQLAANLDAQAVQVIAEHNGIEGNMPYAATWLNQHFNTMFVTFPMALLRWADNRIRSLGYAIGQCVKGADGWSYLGDQVASNVITCSLLLLLQLALSKNTREWIRKKANKEDDEITEEEQEAAQNILFRSGQVRLFSSLLNGEETSTAGHSRGPISALFDSYIADFIPAYNGNENNFGTNLINKIKQKTLGHAPFVLKDAVESIPGNTWLQTSTYYSPGESYLENYGRKVLGYTLGSAQANALADYYKTADETTDDSFLQKLKDGMEYAYTRKFANTKEAKAEHRNYKKAFSLVYEFKKMVDKNAEPYTQTSDSAQFPDLKSDLKDALMFMNDSAALYNVIADYRQKGVTLSTIKSAIKSLSLKQQVLSLDYTTFMQTLSPQEKAVIKSAIAYEEYNYPFLDDIYQELADQYQKEKSNSSNRYVQSVGSLLKTMNYNTPKVYNTNTRRYNNYSNYVNFVNRYLNNVSYNNRYSKKQPSSLDVYNDMMNKQNNGTSVDVWGNKTRHYTDGTEYNVREQGMPIVGGKK